MTQGHHCGYHSRSIGVHTAGLLCRSPSAWLSAPSSSPLLYGLLWLLSDHSNFATKASTLPLFSLLRWANSRDTWKKGLGNKGKSPVQLLGNQPWVKVQNPLWDSGFCLPPARKLSSKVNIYTNMCLLQPPPRPETISKSGLGQTTSDWTRPGPF